ncbi:hypothetical protein O4J56_24515 [Nocardiopsis sp. RSe5-2]|uniref:Uncharacterized protein n=1 Tax=Nocardiopsis endophytica TaxID=3018445 RepID=A0ABT4UA94_9ACTN|nr:hypothetical protein [Nocardiopsis endophytica]MDA2813832.1 hypothetical protein [Nocardiopsis endophytica]
MTTQDLEAVVDDLLALPFPREQEREGDRRGGPGYHVHVLRASEDFWEDRGEEVVEAAEKEIDTAFQALVEALTTRWGEPERVDLTPYLHREPVERPFIDPFGLRTPRAEGPVPEPISELCMLASTMLLWRPPESGRWVCLAVGQNDREFPIELLAAVGDAPIPPREDRGRPL